MKEQHFKNHARFVFTYHVLTGLSLLALVIGAVRNVFKGDGDEDLYNATLILLISLILVSLFIHARRFALKAQDRAIRAEEGLRHFALTGKLLDSRLRIDQVVALRFASDEELPALAQKAAEKNMSNNAIKREIKVWRADYYRV